MTHIVLASGSPRRRELLQRLQLEFTVHVSDVDETVITDPDPVINARETAAIKAHAVAAELAPTEPTLIIGSDTNVDFSGDILGKPVDNLDALWILRRLRGKKHQVHTGIVIIDALSGKTVSGVASTDIHMRAYSDVEIQAYVASGDPLDKAGAYAIQHPEFAPAEKFEGCYSGVMGLSQCLLAELLREFGVETPVDAVALCRDDGCTRITVD